MQLVNRLSNYEIDQILVRKHIKIRTNLRFIYVREIN